MPNLSVIMFLEKFSHQAKNIKISVDSKTLAIANLHCRIILRQATLKELERCRWDGVGDGF
jgi:hypothetical protein